MRLWGEVFSERGPTQEMDGGRKALALSLRLRLLGPDVKKKGDSWEEMGTSSRDNIGVVHVFWNEQT